MKDKEGKGDVWVCHGGVPMCAQLEAAGPSTWGIQLHSNKIRFGWSWRWRPFSVEKPACQGGGPAEADPGAGETLRREIEKEQMKDTPEGMLS